VLHAYIGSSSLEDAVQIREEELPVGGAGRRVDLQQEFGDRLGMRRGGQVAVHIC